jgi:ProP effector
LFTKGPDDNARTAAKALIALLAERWPDCFAVYQTRRRPLKVGIHRDVLAALGDMVTARELSVALGIYTGNVVYLCHCREHAVRIDLDGNAVGVVTAEEAAHAAARLAGRGRAAKRPAAAIAICPHRTETSHH